MSVCSKFEVAWVVIKQELLDHFNGEGMPKDAAEWYERNLDYNVLGGKLYRGMSVVDTVEILKGRALTSDEYMKAAVLGWSVELLQACFLVADDIMDNSITRHGQSCWYRVPQVGHIAINDSFMLESAIYFLLKKHFRSESYYVDLLELFHETTYQTEMGQLIDQLTAPVDKVDLSTFSSKRHSLIVIYKTAYYSLYLPVALAMHMCGVPAAYTIDSAHIQPYGTAKSILIPLGEYFQIQDDFLDFSGSPEQIGKVGTDILDNKCSWCINTALELASSKQRMVLDENYGRKDSAAEGRVKVVFEEVGLREIYRVYEEGVYAEKTLKREVFRSFLNKVYKREK
ncbi:farnesyl-diphosphate synthase [Guyanagaster necrorhizus]|uniref:(2E,6E)-farnesyl diphosphate synthase n=1 Tax=Guyanagaster necrorhizus TaxID=856835 RepID=A0A9P7VU79_9AGAR|nr:farnesyl-diphosphate synthase [Guyanagaster necrorhizus MCA 3950]KAG7447039.1 farnesyl-diphosphate synthase [Guyanagaster necrorhizus MCA 3950]